MLDLAKKLIETYWDVFFERWIPIIMISIGTIVFILETVGGMRAEYGRYNKNNRGLKAPLAWLLQESPAFLIPFGLIVFKETPFVDRRTGQINSNLIVLIFFLIHYFNRSFIYTARIKSEKRVNYMENFLAFVFCTVNGLQIGHYHTKYAALNFNSFNFWIGAFLFFFGLWINIDSDNRLLRLRQSSKDGYKIPEGGFFEYVSAANYFGECLEWVGFAIASWSLPALAFSLFTWSNIGPRAYHHHIYYKEKFGSKYPKKRKAIIPFLI